MRILFVITVLGHGRGGHFFSLDHIAGEIAKQDNVKIISIGTGFSDVLSNNPYFLKHVPFNGLSLIKLNREMRQVAKEYEPDIIHCFDTKCYGVLTCLPALSKYPFVLNKCGGGNPAIYPKVENLIVFSKENKKRFEEQSKYKNSKIHLIPNRVSRLAIKEDPSCQKDQSHFTFVEINRINQAYKKGMLDSIELVKHLQSQNRPVKLIIIGVVEDAIFYDKLKTCTQKEGVPVTFLTEHRFTVKASNYLYLADAVIGIGRGLMEAASLGVPLLTPASNYNYPVLVDASNYEGFFETNFSPRNRVEEKDIAENLPKIYRLIKDPSFYKAQKNFSLSIFDRYFDVQGAREAYTKVYKAACLEGRKEGIMSDSLFKIRNFYSFHKK